MSSWQQTKMNRPFYRYPITLKITNLQWTMGNSGHVKFAQTIAQTIAQTLNSRQVLFCRFYLSIIAVMGINDHVAMDAYALMLLYKQMPLSALCI